jgi:hypothetical protein
MKGFISDLVHGKSASKALRDALAKLGDKMLDMALDNLWKSLMNSGGSNMFAGLGKLFGPIASEPAHYAPGSSLPEVQHMASTMNVTAGTVNIAGAPLQLPGRAFRPASMSGSPDPVRMRTC